MTSLISETRVGHSYSGETTGAFEILDAREVGFEVAKEAVGRIFKLSFAGDPDEHTSWGPETMNVRKDGYFGEDRVFPIDLASGGEMILLAKVGKVIEGFIITAKYPDEKQAEQFGTNARVAEVLWLAVNPAAKRSGIGTALMIEMMRIAQAAGKQELRVKFRGPGRIFNNPKRDEEPLHFYESIEKRHKIKIQWHGSIYGYLKAGYSLNYDFEKHPHFTNKTTQAAVLISSSARLPFSISRIISLYAFFP